MTKTMSEGCDHDYWLKVICTGCDKQIAKSKTGKRPICTHSSFEGLTFGSEFIARYCPECGEKLDEKEV